MKKLIIPFLLAAMTVPFIFAHGAFADSDAPASFARIEAEDVYLYASPDESEGLFVLPSTYFVQILGETALYYYVSYLQDNVGFPSVKGYCKKTEVKPVDYTPETPFLEYTITVTYSVAGSIAPDDPLSTYTAEAVYYGEFHFGTSVFYYVNIGGKFGYVPAKSCSVPNYPINTEHTSTEQRPNQDTAAGSTAQSNAVRIVLICILAVFAIGAVYFLFRPQKTPKPSRDPFYDENENY